MTIIDPLPEKSPVTDPKTGRMSLDWQRWFRQFVSNVSTEDTGFIKKDGTVAFTGNQSMGSHKLTSVTDPTAAQDAATKNYVDAEDATFIKKDGSRAFTGDQSHGGFNITNVGTVDGVDISAHAADVNAHHAQTHTIASHDTTATGANLTTLTNDSMADALHRHSELSASDGTPNPALSVDAAGNVGIGTAAPAQALHVVGNIRGTAGLILGYVAKTANYTLTTADYTVNCTSNSFDLTLPTAVGATGQIYNLKNSGTGTITLKTTSSQTIDGDASGALTLTQYENLKVQSDGANWMIL